MTEFIKLPSASESIQIGFTDQKISGRAGMAPFSGFLGWHGLSDIFAKLLPHKPTSNNATPPEDYALGFMAGILAGAEKLTQVAFLRRDVILPKLLGIRCFGSQSSFTRFFQKFKSSATNLEVFNPLWKWGMDRLNSRKGGYSLDLDSTRLLHEDGHQEGVQVGYTRLGLKPCLHPLLAVLEEPKLVVGFWLRPGNSGCANNVVAFTQNLLAHKPSHIHLRMVRADSGFCVPEWLDFLEAKNLNYIVVARLLKPLQRLLKQELLWGKSEVPGMDVAETMHQEINWSSPRRVILIRSNVKEKERAAGKKLFDSPGYRYQALVTNLPPPVGPLECWRDYNNRAGCECVIKQLDQDFALPKLCLEKFWSTEAALSLSVLSYNLCVLFQRHMGWLDRVTAGTLRFRMFTTGGTISKTGGVTTIRLSVPEADRPWWRTVFEKISTQFRNCNAVDFLPT